MPVGDQSHGPSCGMQGGDFWWPAHGNSGENRRRDRRDRDYDRNAFGPGAIAGACLITQAINPTNLTTLFGNTRPEANAANDRGRVPDSMLLNHMLLQLQRSDVQEQAFDTLIDQLHDRNSPNFHKWLSVSEIGTRFGPAAADIQTITGWLQQNGFTVNLVYTNGMVIDFPGRRARSGPPSTPKSITSPSMGSPISPIWAIPRFRRRWRPSSSVSSRFTTSGRNPSWPFRLLAAARSTDASGKIFGVFPIDQR
jgi:hypothetical protein